MGESIDYLALLEHGDAKALARAFAGEPVIDDPRVGRVEGRDALDRFVDAAGIWLDEHVARTMRVATTRNDQREVQESVVGLEMGEGPCFLPIAVVLDGGTDGLREIRVYHSLWPLTGEHKVRAPLLAPDPSVALRGAPADYHRALAAGDVEGILAAYEPNATAREPSGGPYTYIGAEQIRHIYTWMFSEGGIGLEFCTATDDGTACAIEYNAVRWGKTELPPQAGIAVYARGKSGRLAAARIYDDVAPPASADSTQD